MVAPRFLAFLPLLFLAAAAPAPKQNALAGYRVVQMTRGPKNHLLVRATVNGNPATFLVDTGSDVSLLRADRAQRLGAHAAGKNIRTAGNVFASATVADFQIGQVHLGEVRFALNEPGEAGGASRGEVGVDIDGLIGLDLLRSRVAVINCHTRQLFFRTETARPLDLAAATRGLGFRAVPIILYRGRILTVPGRLNGRIGRLILDTGAFVTALADDVIRSIPIDTVPSRLTARGFDGKVRPVELARVSGLRIGDVAIAPQSFAVIDFFDSRKQVRTFTGINRIEVYAEKNPVPGDRILGLLGDELLDQREAIIDLENMKLFLK